MQKRTRRRPLCTKCDGSSLAKAPWLIPLARASLKCQINRTRKASTSFHSSAASFFRRKELHINQSHTLSTVFRGGRYSACCSASIWSSSLCGF